MTGVEILASNEILVKSAFNWSLFWITYGAMVFCLSLFGIIISLRVADWNALAIFIVIALPFGALGGAAVGATYSIPTKYETQYKVTISDDILMNDFLEQYEILDQEGKIYTVREIKEDAI